MKSGIFSGACLVVCLCNSLLITEALPNKKTNISAEQQLKQQTTRGQLSAPISNSLSTNTIPQLVVKRQSTEHTNNNSINSTSSTKREGNGIEINYETKWYTQLVDHFTWANQDTYQQRYLVNKDNWCGKNCPILFYCGNEGDIEVFTNNTGWMWENAKNLRAMLVFAEHRFYGKSMPYPIDPTKVTPNATKTLGYLSSEQALADYAKLIFSLKNEIYDAKYSAVIAIGGSYGGMLAAWMRMKYPNAVTGALAGSAPILQFSEEYECSQFNQIVTKDFENYSPHCSQSVAKSWSILQTLGESDQGLAQLSSAFHTCKPMQKVDADLLIELLTGIWVNLAMTDYANEADFLSKMPAYPIKHVCNVLSTDPVYTSDAQLMQSIAKASQVYTNYTGQLVCLDIEAAVQDPMDVLWDFQSCTEMVMPICADGINDMFPPQPFDIPEFVSGCEKRWGVKTQVNKIRTIFGDKKLESASNIIFSSCSRDPWSAGCPQDSFEDRHIHAIKIPGVCHHEDLRAAGPNDSNEIKKARQDELNIISDWIQKHYEHLKNSNSSSNETVRWHKIKETSDY